MEAVCRVDVVADVDTKNSLGFLTASSADLVYKIDKGIIVAILTQPQ